MQWGGRLCALISWSLHYHKPSSFKREKYLHDWPFLIASPSSTTSMDLIKVLTPYTFFIYTRLIEISIFQTFCKLSLLPTCLACFYTPLLIFLLNTGPQLYHLFPRSQYSSAQLPRT